MRQAVETVLATIIVPGAADVLVPFLILSKVNQGLPDRIGVAQVLAVGTAVIGTGMAVWVSYTFVVRGHGTPIPVDPPRHFVAEGLFRYVRNPMYGGALLILLSEALFFQSWWLLLYAAGLWAALHTFLVVLEEPQLERRFGETYREYLASTPRWIPRRPHDRGA